MTRLVKCVIGLLFLPIWWLQLLIPRNENVWVFGAWNGRRFADNSKYLYLYVKDNHPEIEPIWLTRDPTIRDAVNEMGGTSFLINSPKGIYFSLRAKNFFVSSGKLDVNCLCGNGARWTQLWHGNPMKKIGLDDKFSPVHHFFQRRIVPVLFPYIYLYNYDYVVSNAAIFTDRMSSAFNIPLNRILETGCPRNDVFLQAETDRFNEGLRTKFKGCKLVYYLPTFRSHNGAESLFALKDYEQTELEAFLERENIVFVSKGHFVDDEVEGNIKNSDSRLFHLSDQEVSDINFMLKDADLLITDYSSAYFDFLLTERPLIFAAFDLEEYLAGSREMYFKYEDTVAGPIIKNWSELYEALASVWDDSQFKALVREKNRLFNKYHDTHNSKRVFEAISTH